MLLLLVLLWGLLLLPVSPQLLLLSPQPLHE
jgi:hypothetical protein